MTAPKCGISPYFDNATIGKLYIGRILIILQFRSRVYVKLTCVD